MRLSDMGREKWNRNPVWTIDKIFHKQKIPDSEKSVPSLSDIIPCVNITPIVLAEQKPDIGEIRSKPMKHDTIAKRFTANLSDLDKANNILNKHK